MSGTSFWFRPGQFPSRRAARSAARRASSSIATTNSPAWTPSPTEGRTPRIELMLATVLIMALAVSVEPFRIGMTVLMLNRPRPALQLFAFLCGGFSMGTTVGLVVLFVFRRIVLGSNFVTVPRVQILIGLLVLFIAAVVAVDVPGRLGPRPAKLATPAWEMLKGDSLPVAGIAGLSIALPSVDYLAALAVILASGAAALTQVAVLVMFNVVAFALVEIPLLAYLLAPKATARSVAVLHDWIRSRRRRDVAILLSAIGCAFLAVGPSGLRPCLDPVRCPPVRPQSNSSPTSYPTR